MKRQVQGLSCSAIQNEVADGVYLVRVQRARYHWHKHKPFYELSFYVLEPAALTGAAIAARLYCSPKMLWRFAWFLRDFRYTQELLDRDEIDTKALIGLQGVVQVANTTIQGRAEVHLKAFAPAADWEHLQLNSRSSEVA